MCTTYVEKTKFTGEKPKTLRPGSDTGNLGINLGRQD